MRRHRSLIAVAAAMLAIAPFAMSVGGTAAADDTDRPRTSAEDFKASILARGQAGKARLTTGTAAAALPPGSVGNDIFRVYVEQSPGLGVGTFTVLTGPKHPAGPGHDVLFGNGIPGTSYMIVRARHQPDDPALPTSDFDFVQGALLTHETEQSLDDLIQDLTLNVTGFTAEWRLSFLADLHQTVQVHGTTLADTSIEVTTSISESTPSETFTIQYLWDVAAGVDDGPVLQTQQAGTVFRPFAPTRSTELTLAPTDNSLAVADNDGTPAPQPNLGIGISGAGPSWLQAAPTAPDSVKYACWPRAIYSPIGEYEIDESYDIATPATDCTNSNGHNDSAVISHWVRAGGSPISVSQSLFSSPRNPYPTAMTATSVLLQAPVFSATLTDTTTGQRLAGRTVAFSVGNTVRCTAVTNASGVARCGTLIDRLAAILGLGYNARFQGNAIWATATARGRLL